VATACEKQVVRDLRGAAFDTYFLEEIDPPGDKDDESTPLGSGANRYRLYFRIIDEETTPREHPHTGPDVAPYLLVLVDVEPDTGNIVGYRYDLIDRAYQAHFGYHLHSEGGPPVSHKQGCHVPDGRQSHPPVALQDVVHELIAECFAHRLGRG
jgi:hypothetical protein